MLKILMTLMRGAAAAAEEEVADRHALLILDQQIRDVAANVDRSKRALAVAIAQDEAEAKRLEKLESRIADLEERALAALKGGREDLAAEAADAIAALEADRAAIGEARASFAAEIHRLKRTVGDASRRLSELERGRRIAQAAEAVRRLKAGRLRPGSSTAAALSDAEATLARLREKQAEDAAADAALGSLETEATSIADRLEAEGFGRRTKPSGAEVLARLKRQAGPAAPTT
ncbi:MAG TPA: PspA/IM30 family protein [Microvirga sp.]|nr:PspA/IM30 family protein [Microvirga sp.]